jgi:N-glycosylase/DNA lyase
MRGYSGKPEKVAVQPRELSFAGMAQLAWTSWKPLHLPTPITSRTLEEILDGGQAFRWNRISGIWRGIWSRYIVEVSIHANDSLAWRTVEGNSAAAESALRQYLALDGEIECATDQLPWRSDTHLHLCLRGFQGLRILRQPFGETLLCFLCSATKQIVQIKQMVELLAQRHGEMLVQGIHALPTWEKLAQLDEAPLRECLLGFRARYIHATARFLAENPGWLQETESLPYAEAKSRLCSLPGVGEKVADCVLLFGAGKLEAFPVDVWIIKTMQQRYGLAGWKPAQIAQFGRVHFGPAAGLAQQFLFAYERESARSRRAAAAAPRGTPELRSN